MRRLLTSVLALSLMTAGFWPLAAPVTANLCDHAAIVASGRLHGTLAVASTKRFPVAQSTVTLFATVVPNDASALAWTHELVVVPCNTFPSLTGRSAASPRAPPAHLVTS